MVIGIRELKLKFSRVIDSLNKSKVVVVTKSDQPVATLLSIDKALEIAHMSKDKYLIRELDKVLKKEPKDLDKEKERIMRSIDSLLESSSKDRANKEYVEKLTVIKVAIETLISERWSRADEKLFYYLSTKIFDPFGKMIENDYYNISGFFIKKVKEAHKLSLNLVKNSSPATKIKIERSLRIFEDLQAKAKIDTKQKDSKAVRKISEVLIEVNRGDSEKYYTICLLIPFDGYYGKNENLNIIDSNVGLGGALVGKSVGETIKLRDYSYKILAIG